MKKLKTYIFSIVAITLLISSCQKNESSAGVFSPEKLKILEADEVKYAMDAVAGDGLVLLSYVDNADNYQFKLVDNSGEELWTKNFGYKYEITPRTTSGYGATDTIISIVYDSDNTFSIFRANSLKKINMEGDVVFSDNSFFEGMESSTFLKVKLGSNNNYLVFGEIVIAGNRAFAGEYTRNGDRNFLTFHTVNLLGNNTITDVQKNTNGNFLFAGTFRSNTLGLESSFFTLELDPSGVLVNVMNYEIEDFSASGRQLYQGENGSFIYLVSSADSVRGDRRSRMFQINETGEILNLSYLNLADVNFGPNKALLQKRDGSFIGLMKTGNEIPTIQISVVTTILAVRPGTFGTPNYSYYFETNKNGLVQNQKFIQSSYSNYFNAVISLSNGDVLVYGAVQSFGEDVKLAMMLKR